MTNKFLLLLTSFLSFFLISCQEKNPRRILVFSKTDGFRHESIPHGIKMFNDLGAEKGFDVVESEDASIIDEKNLKDFTAVVFLNTTMDIFNPSQQVEFQRYIQAGGGFVGVHAAADTEYEWPWYGGLVGAYFNGHPNNPNVRDAVVRKTEYSHPCTDHLPEEWARTDEWYNYRDINPNINSVLNLDESSYEGGTNGDYHPIAWYHEYDGGRSFYTGGGHTNESYEDPDFVQHIWEGLRYVMGDMSGVNYEMSTVMPEENRFQKVVLDSYFNEPMELELMPDGRIVFIERRGLVKLYDPDLGRSTTIAELEVYSGQEDGLMGIALDPDFTNNRWAYICYSDPDESHQNLSRFVFDPDADEVLSDEIVMLEVPTQRLECCHSAGSVEFGPQGNLWVSFGDNTNPHQSDGYAPIDEREGRFPFDAQKSSSNANDLRGGIIRIRPESDGSYSIPDGNLFPKDGSGGRPEIYVMGCRNPFRFSIDSETYALYWGEVGPDAGNDGDGRGPRGYDEVNQAKGPGFFGWPYFIGDNKAYNDHDFAQSVNGPLFDPTKPINSSPNNTGPNDLPPAQPAMVWYPYAESDDFPLVGTGGRNAMAGPAFHLENYPDNERRYPAYYDDKLFVYDWMRGWIMAVSFDENGDMEKMEQFLPSVEWNNLMDIVLSPDGDMYMLEYGTGWFTANEDARLVHLKYTSGNRTPVARLSVDESAGGLPFAVRFDGQSSTDNDGDALSFRWDFGDGSKAKGAVAEHTYDKPGTYTAILTVKDQDGLEATDQINIHAGNNPPEVDIQVSGNSSFYLPGMNPTYEVVVNDTEDGEIEESRITLTLDYLEMGHDITEIAQGHQIVSESERGHPGLTLIENSDCRSCHKVEGTSIGPSYINVASKYKVEEGAVEYLASKIIRGGGGVWGETAMAAHPAISEQDAKTMSTYIMSLTETSSAELLGQSGQFVFTVPEGKKPGGSFVALASYTDGGAEAVGAMRSEKQLVFRSPALPAPSADIIENATTFVVSTEMAPQLEEDLEVVVANDQALLTYRGLDLTGIGSVQIIASASAMFAGGGTIHISLDDGESIGTAVINTTPGMQDTQNLTIPLGEVSGIHDLNIRMAAASERPVGTILMVILLPSGSI